MIRFRWLKNRRALSRVGRKPFEENIRVGARKPYGFSLFSRSTISAGEEVFVVDGIPTKTASNLTIPFDEVWKI